MFRNRLYSIMAKELNYVCYFYILKKRYNSQTSWLFDKKFFFNISNQYLIFCLDSFSY